MRRLDTYDPRWLTQAVDGDHDAWQCLVHHFASLVHSIPRRIGLPTEECEDVFQTVFAILYERAGMIEDPQSLPKWLTTTTTRESWRVLRRRRSAPSAAELLDPGAVDLESGAILADHERDVLVGRALREIGEECERLLRLLFATEPRPAYAEIAESLGIAVGTIGPRRARCLQAMLERLRGLPEAADAFSDP